MNSLPLPIIAIDGPAASGKGTLARQLAQYFQFDHLDTGLLYRVVGRGLLDAQKDPHDVDAATALAQSLVISDLMREDLRGEEVAQAASICSSIPGVRAALFDFQIQFSKQPPQGIGALLDGRDIGTVVCPQAPFKLWVYASPLVRAQRRYAERVALGDYSLSVDDIAASIADRDEREMNRLVSPLKPADDAIHIDTSGLTVEETFQKAISIIEPRLRQMQLTNSLGSTVRMKL